MAQWSKNKVLPENINGNQEFTRDNNFTIEELNAIVNNSFYASDMVESMGSQPNVQNVNNVGVPNVSIETFTENGQTKKRFKFENLKGEKGEQGIQGEKGEQGEKGVPNSLRIGTVEAGETANATITGESPEQLLNLVLPRGEKGENGDDGVGFYYVYDKLIDEIGQLGRIPNYQIVEYDRVKFVPYSLIVDRYGTVGLTDPNSPVEGEINYTTVFTIKGQDGQSSTDVGISEFVKEFTTGFSRTEVSGNNEWVQQSFPVLSIVSDICFGNGYYVAEARTKIVYSQDGVNWILGTQIPESGLSKASIAYGNGYFVVDYGGFAYRSDSPFGEWESSNTGGFGGGACVRYLNNRFVAVGARGSICMSYDGKTWTAKTDITDQTFTDVAYGNGRYVCVGTNGTLFISFNGETWHQQSIDSVAGTFYSVAYVNGKFVAGTTDKRIFYSVDGITWTQSTVTNHETDDNFTYISKFAYFDNRLYGLSHALDGNGYGIIFESKDKGLTWESVKSEKGISVITAGNDKFVVAGYNAVLYLLDLGIVWSYINPHSVHTWYRFKLFQNNGVVLYSDLYNDEVPKISYDEATNTLNIITE